MINVAPRTVREGKALADENQTQSEIAAARQQKELDLRRQRRLARLRETEGEESRPRASNLDVLAFIIASFQVLGPILLAMIGVVTLAYFLFRLVFS